MVKPMKKLEKRQQRAPEKELKEDTTVVNEVNPEELASKLKAPAIALVVVAALLIGWFWQSGKTSQEAEEHFGIAMVDIRINNIEKAENKLNFIISEFPSSQAANKATYFLADIYLKKGVYASAREYFQSYKGNDILLESAAHAGIALSYEKEGNFAEAASSYDSAASISGENGSNTAKYLFSAGINYELAKNNDAAKKSFQSIKDDFASFEKINIVNMKLASL